MTRLRRAVLVLLLFALPIQGALAASRVCMAMMSAQPATETARGAHAHHAGHEAGTQHEHTDPAPQQRHGAHDHAAETCTLCAACCLTVAGAPPAPTVASADASYAGHRPLAVPVLHNVADGLERPPRTI